LLIFEINPNKHTPFFIAPPPIPTTLLRVGLEASSLTMTQNSKHCIL